MAIYHLSVKTLAKGGGRSAVQFSAYMDGVQDVNERTGEVYDHTSKEEVTYSNIHFSDDVPQELQDRHAFWQALEDHETRANARFARTFEVALPIESTHEEHIAMVNQFKDELMKQGYSCVQVAIHDKEGNPHAHIMVPCRQMENGQWKNAKEIKGYCCTNEYGDKKTFASSKDIEEANTHIKDAKGKWERVPLLDKDGQPKLDSRNRKQWKRETMQKDPLNSKEALISQREAWANICNQYLEPENQISHLSLKAQGIDREPTKHMGYAANALEKQGIVTDIGEYNRGVTARNERRILEKQLAKVQAYIQKCEEQLKEILSHVRIPESAERLKQYLSDRTGSVAGERRQDSGIDLNAFRVQANNARASADDNALTAEKSRDNRSDREAERERQRIEQSRRLEAERRARETAEREAKERAERAREALKHATGPSLGD